MYQIFVKGLDGKTKCLQVSTPNLAVSDLKGRLFDLLKIPPHFQRLVSGTCQIADDALMVAARDGLYPQVHLLLRLRAGKGGFGSLLRGAATKAGQKKTSNFDACRDMSGRRLRHVNAEKKLEEWKAEAQERQLEKIAEDYLKKQAKIMKKSDPRSDEGARDVEKYRTEASRAMEAVECAVKDGLQEALRLQQNGKRKKIEEPQFVDRKRAKLWMLEEEDEEEEIDEMMGMENQGISSMKDPETGSCSTKAESASDNETTSFFKKGTSETDSCNDDVTMEVPVVSLGENDNGCNEIKATIVLEKEESTFLGDNYNGCGKNDPCVELKKEDPVTSSSIYGQNITLPSLIDDETISDANVEKSQLLHPEMTASDTVGCLSGNREPHVELNKDEPVASSSIEGKNITSPSLVEDEITSNANVEKCQLSCSEISASVTAGCSSDTTGVQGEMDSVCDSNGSMAGPLNFNDFNTAEEMEVLGLERLKNELQIRGLKCGGSVTERAARLFLLKITPLEKLHKKHFAKSKDLGK